MIKIFILLVLVSSISGAETTAAATRTYCNLPDAIYNDGISTIAWGSSGGWNYGNAAKWKGIFNKSKIRLRCHMWCQ